LKQAAQDKANAMNAFINKPAPGTKWLNQINCTVFQQDLGAVIYLAEQQIRGVAWIGLTVGRRFGAYED
jgi:hypothetical protein